MRDISWACSLVNSILKVTLTITLTANNRECFSNRRFSIIGHVVRNQVLQASQRPAHCLSWRVDGNRAFTSPKLFSSVKSNLFLIFMHSPHSNCFISCLMWSFSSLCHCILDEILLKDLLSINCAVLWVFQECRGYIEASSLKILCAKDFILLTLKHYYSSLSPSLVIEVLLWTKMFSVFCRDNTLTHSFCYFSRMG